jgi:hypothetical protein
MEETGDVTLPVTLRQFATRTPVCARVQWEQSLVEMDLAMPIVLLTMEILVAKPMELVWETTVQQTEPPVNVLLEPLSATMEDAGKRHNFLR